MKRRDANSSPPSRLLAIPNLGAVRRPWMVHLRGVIASDCDLVSADGGADRQQPPVRRVAVMFPLPAADCSALSEALGAGWTVVDGRDVEAADAVLMLPCSEQTTVAVRNLFPEARLIVIDAADDDCTRASGPVEPCLAAGADLYCYQPPRRAA